MEDKDLLLFHFSTPPLASPQNKQRLTHIFRNIIFSQFYTFEENSNVKTEYSYEKHYTKETCNLVMQKTKMYIVRSLSMANWLCNNGFQILKVEDNEKDSRLKVFLFEDTGTLRNTMARFEKNNRGV